MLFNNGNRFGRGGSSSADNFFQTFFRQETFSPSLSGSLYQKKGTEPDFGIFKSSFSWLGMVTRSVTQCTAN